MTTAHSRTVLITGASSGIGLACAMAAARAGFTTIATVRTPEGAVNLRNAALRAHVSLDIRQLEVTDPASVKRCVDGVLETHGRLDALVNNAGVANSSPTL